jgi:hypothetical protein
VEVEAKKRNQGEQPITADMHHAICTSVHHAPSHASYSPPHYDLRFLTKPTNIFEVAKRTKYSEAVMLATWTVY